MTNYTSIEKLAVLKPQSKDYILCFDTSSIDQNSSCTSNDVAFNYNISNTQENLFSDSELIQNSSKSSMLFKFLYIYKIFFNLKDLLTNSEGKFTSEDEHNQIGNVMINSMSVLDENKSNNEALNTSINQSITNNLLIEYPDSGIGSARTLSPLSVFNNNNTQSCNSNHSTSM